MYTSINIYIHIYIDRWKAREREREYLLTPRVIEDARGDAHNQVERGDQQLRVSALEGRHQGVHPP